MKLEVGKYYMTRDGEKVGPIEIIDTDRYDYIGSIGTFRSGGSSRAGSDPDLIAEWPADETTSDARMVITAEDTDPIELLQLAVMSLTEKGQYEYATVILDILRALQDE